MSNYSGTYIAVVVLTAFTSWLGIKASQSDLQATANVIAAIIIGLLALWRRYRAGGITKLGTRIAKN